MFELTHLTKPTTISNLKLEKKNLFGKKIAFGRTGLSVFSEKFFNSFSFKKIVFIMILYVFAKM